MKHPLLLLAILGVVSLTMRFTASPPSSNPVTAPTSAAIHPPKSKSAQDLVYLLGANSAPAKRNPKTVYCYLGEPQPTYTKAGPYLSSQELCQDLDHRELWIGNILAAPVWRKSKPFGIRIFFKTPTPFARLGLQSGDILLSLNDIKMNRVEDCPALFGELRSGSPMHFLVERKGAIVPLDIDLR